eukprot:2735230-Amphidinium_carterae.1
MSPDGFALSRTRPKSHEPGLSSMSAVLLLGMVILHMGSVACQLHFLDKLDMGREQATIAYKCVGSSSAIGANI